MEALFPMSHHGRLITTCSPSLTVPILSCDTLSVKFVPSCLENVSNPHLNVQMVIFRRSKTQLVNCKSLWHALSAYPHPELNSLRPTKKENMSAVRVHIFATSECCLGSSLLLWQGCLQSGWGEDSHLSSGGLTAHHKALRRASHLEKEEHIRCNDLQFLLLKARHRKPMETQGLSTELKTFNISLSGSLDVIM